MRGAQSRGKGGQAGGGRSGRPPQGRRGQDSRRGNRGGKPGARGARRFNGDRAQAQKPRRRTNDKPALELIEGRRAVAEALELGVPIRRAYIQNGLDGTDQTLAQLVMRLNAADVPVEYVAKGRLDGQSSHGAHQGIMVRTDAFEYASVQDIIANAGEGDALVLLLDHVTDEGNFGAIVRSAEVVGAAGVIIANARAAGVGVGAYKTSAGAVLHVPIAQVSNLASAVDLLKEAGFWVAGSTEHARQDVWSAPMGGRLCIVMGSEGDGISRLMREKCDFECRLPQHGRVESLNVAQAATVMSYEWLRRCSLEESADA